MKISSTLWDYNRNEKNFANMHFVFFPIIHIKLHLFVAQSLSCVWLFATPWTIACQASLSTISGSLLRLRFIESWCHPTISSSVAPFSSCLQSFPASGSFPMMQLFTLGGQSIGASASVCPMNIQGWFPSGWTGLMSLPSEGLSRVFLQHHGSKASILLHSAFFRVQPFYYRLNAVLGDFQNINKY